MGDIRGATTIDGEATTCNLRRLGSMTINPQYVYFLFLLPLFLLFLFLFEMKHALLVMFSS